MLHTQLSFRRTLSLAPKTPHADGTLRLLEKLQTAALFAVGFFPIKLRTEGFFFTYVNGLDINRTHI